MKCVCLGPEVYEKLLHRKACKGVHGVGRCGGKEETAGVAVSGAQDSSRGVVRLPRVKCVV